MHVVKEAILFSFVWVLQFFDLLRIYSTWFYSNQPRLKLRPNQTLGCKLPLLMIPTCGKLFGGCAMHCSKTFIDLSLQGCFWINLVLRLQKPILVRNTHQRRHPGEVQKGIQGLRQPRLAKKFPRVRPPQSKVPQEILRCTSATAANSLTPTRTGK